MYLDIQLVQLVQFLNNKLTHSTTNGISITVLHVKYIIYQ